MKRTLILTLSTIGLVVAAELVARAQSNAVTDFQTWLQQQTPTIAPTPDPSEQAQQEVRDRIAAVRAAHQTTITLARTGHWQSTRFLRQPQAWQVQLQKNTQDGSITGSLRLVGSALFTQGLITGHVDDTTVAGIVTNASGAQLATFTGSVFAAGMSGTYATSDGDVGTWSADGTSDQ